MDGNSENMVSHLSTSIFLSLSLVQDSQAVVHNLGPQTAFPVPEGILNYQGINYIALSLWSQDSTGNSLSSLNLTSSTPVQSGFGNVALVDSPPYSPRPGAY
jgi:beta-galactosidase